MTNALATQRRMRNDIIIMDVKSAKGSVHRDHYFYPAHGE
jgi:hypothetical protein